MKDSVYELERHVVTGDPVSEGLAQELVDWRPNPLQAALLALASDPDLRGPWAGSVAFDELTPAQMIAYVLTETDRVEQAIDDGLAAGSVELVEALARAQVPWEHPALAEALDDDQCRASAALVLGAAESPAFREWLEDVETFEDAFVGLRAAAVTGFDEAREIFEDWDENLAELDGAEAERDHLQGLAATLDPTWYARKLLRGEFDSRWLSDSQAVADFLQRHGATEWLEVLAVFDWVDDEAFELAAMLAVCASAAVGRREPDEGELEKLHDVLAVTDPGGKFNQWEAQAAELGFGFQLAVGEGDELVLLACQVAAHERLVTHGYHSPGVPGLPLSGTDAETIDLDALTEIRQALEAEQPGTPVQKVALVRTLADLRRLVDHGPEDHQAHAETWVDSFLDHDAKAVRLLVRQLLAVVDFEAGRRETEITARNGDIGAALVASIQPDEPVPVVDNLFRAARDESVLAMECARRLALVDGDPGFEELARLWAEGPLWRAAFYRDVLWEGIELAMGR